MQRGFIYQNGNLSTSNDLGEMVEAWQQRNGTVWIDFQDPTDEEYQFLAEDLQIHPLAVEDCQELGVSPKMEDYDTFLFFIFRGINHYSGIHALDTLGLKIFFMEGLVITVHQGSSKTISQVTQQLSQNGHRMESIELLLYTILDTLTDNIMPVIHHIEERLEAFQHRLFKKFDPIILEEMFELKKWVLRLKRFVIPQREIILNLLEGDHPVFEEKLYYYLRDVLDHTQQVLDYLEIYEGLFPDTMNSYLSQVTNRLNEVMKTMSLIATLMLPLSFITGFFGMNFQKMPLISAGLGGFWIALGLMVATFVGMVIFFWKKDWF